MKGQFLKYDHVERLNHPEVRDIDIGQVYVFPKLDGTNGSLWIDADRLIQAGSRNRVLSVVSDNHGFCAWARSDDPRAFALREYLRAHPYLTVYGEWLVPHSLKTYRDDAWRRFYVFDVYDHDLGGYLSWEQYGEGLEGLGVDVI